MGRSQRSGVLRLAVLIGAVALLVSACGSDPAALRKQVHVVPNPFHHYVALGDSYTAAPFVPDTETTDGCYRSSSNYPAQLATSFGITDVSDRSCGGATTTSMTKPLRNLPPQFDALNAKTDLVTLGIGGNDQGMFPVLITKCPALRAQDPTGAPCKAALDTGGTDTILAAEARTAQRVKDVIDEIHRRAPNARVALIGYPQLVPTHGTCAAVPIATGDYAWFRMLGERFNSELQQVAQETGSVWIDVWKASQGHDACSSHPWVNGSVTNLNAAAAYHPFLVEQTEVAKLLVAALRSP